ncbi:MAG: hypothetical protein KJ787_01480 [Gammaproteobacteria bacterium]|nr:hypothetical protein [Gammaproteobacteria bacterium]MBU1644989.1 hypothetical protein [Gammaproteobacteria bacterium]MBU1971448.1 hypothetical protein [Gammaproteobacteria bacterium]
MEPNEAHDAEGGIPAGQAPGDVARAETELPLTAGELFDFLHDIERLFRLNPHLAIERWLPLDEGMRFVAHNDSNDRQVAVAAWVEIVPAARSIALHYESGLKQATEFGVEATDGGARLVVTERYPRIEDPADPRVADVDKSLVPWVAALRRHLLARRRWGRLPLLFPLWRWWNERFMLGMPPRSRRIVRLIVWVSALEFAVFLAAIAVLRVAS